MHPHEAITNLPARDDMQFETRLEALKRERLERTATTEARHAEAEGKGELWTAHAALYPGACICFVYNGRVPEAQALNVENPECSVFMGPVFLTGSQQAAMVEALSLFRVNDITIRVVHNA